jgi:NADPH-dependent dioxygenase
MREERKEVLVVGAGPVGLWTAFLLARSGVEVKIIDSQDRTAARSYACGVHSHTLEALARVGLAEELISKGRRVETVAFYEGEKREAELKLGKTGGAFPFLLIAPQSALEEMLEAQLAKLGVHVNWMHRLDDFSKEEESLSVRVEELSGTSTGYVVPHWETTVKRDLPIRVQFLVGADGNHSMARRRCGLEYRQFGPAEMFAAYEFEAEEDPGSEVRVVFSGETTNILWPQPGTKWRWTFQVAPEGPASFPDKERRAVRFLDTIVDERLRDYVQRIGSKRAPWFRATVKDVTWCTRVAFEQRLVSSFGQDRCWLAGDAAHQTGPAGVQSMNSGFMEAEMLAGILKQIIHENGDTDLLKEYDRVQKQNWEKLMGPGALKAREGASSWVTKHAARLLPCVPGVGANLEPLAGQIGLG